MLPMKLTIQLKWEMHGWCKIHIVKMWSTRSHKPFHTLCALACANGHCMETCASTKWQCILHVLISHWKWLFIIVGDGMDLIVAILKQCLRTYVLALLWQWVWWWETHITNLAPHDLVMEIVQNLLNYNSYVSRINIMH
jgi:hypothetical protein